MVHIPLSSHDFPVFHSEKLPTGAGFRNHPQCFEGGRTFVETMLDAATHQLPKWVEAKLELAKHQRVGLKGNHGFSLIQPAAFVEFHPYGFWSIHISACRQRKYLQGKKRKTTRLCSVFLSGIPPCNNCFDDNNPSRL